MPKLVTDRDGEIGAVGATRDEIAYVFTEWLLRYHEDPERFEAEYPDDEDDYGTGCATYFVKLLSELS